MTDAACDDAVHAPAFSGIVATRESAVEVSKPVSERVHVAKTRKCLKCREPFESEWSGERVCKHCKSLNSWREAMTSTPVYEVSRRR